MYSTHAINCQLYAQKSAENMMDVALMVALSIQQNWLSVGNQLADVRINKSNSKFLWGNKSKTYKYLKSNHHKIYAQMRAVINSNQTDTVKSLALMRIFLRIDGLGLPKAGFMCQLTAGLVGCMDVHNIKMYNLKIKDLTLAKNPKGFKGKATNNGKIVAYVTLCKEHGTENLWNSWCNFVASKSISWKDGNHVSSAHYNYLLGVGAK